MQQSLSALQMFSFDNNDNDIDACGHYYTHTEKTYKNINVIVIYDRNENINIWNT